MRLDTSQLLAAGPLSVQTKPLLLSAATATAVTGMSWQWCCKFARKHGVKLLRIGERKQLIDAAQLIAAIERVAAERAPKTEDLSEAEQLMRLRAELGLVPA